MSQEERIIKEGINLNEIHVAFIYAFRENE